MQQNNKTTQRVYIWLPLLLSLMLVAGIIIGMRLTGSQPTLVSEVDQANVSSPGAQSKIEQLLRFIESKYVDDVNRDQLVDEAIKSILEQLDPHSSYIPAEELSKITEQLEGNFEGIGVEFMILQDTVVVVTPISGGPAESVGIKAGDKIVQVEDSVIAGTGITNAGIISLLKGEQGTSVRIGVLRPSTGQVKEYEITRDRIPINSIDASYMLTENTGYIKIARFAATTDREFIDALEQLEQEGMTDLLIDLRNNPGGYLQKATNMLNQLFNDKGDLMVYTEGRSVNRNNYKSTGRGIFTVDKIAVLIDEGSASASEILAGAIQDHDRGIIVGRRSFGKGLVQEQYRLRDGSALRLTIARYYTPSGRSIQKPYEDLDAYKNDFNDRYESGELLSENNIDLTDSTRYFTDNGRVVYGGGGIIPDVFVPIDTQHFSNSFLNLNQQIPNYTFKYIEKHKASLESMDLKSFSQEYTISDADFKDFLSYAKSNEVKYDRKDLNTPTQKMLKQFLKARVAKHYFDELGYHRVLNENDPMIREALSALATSEALLKRTKFQD